MDDAVFTVGRVLMGSLFVAGCLRHLSLLGPLTEALRGRGVPLPRTALLAASAFQLVAGGCLMAGVLVVPAALGLIAFTAVASVVMLDFWNRQGETRETFINICLSNVAIIGGLLMAAAAG